MFGHASSTFGFRKAALQAADECSFVDADTREAPCNEARISRVAECGLICYDVRKWTVRSIRIASDPCQGTEGSEAASVNSDRSDSRLYLVQRTREAQCRRRRCRCLTMNAKPCARQPATSSP